MKVKYGIAIAILPGPAGIVSIMTIEKIYIYLILEYNLHQLLDYYCNKNSIIILAAC